MTILVLQETEAEVMIDNEACVQCPGDGHDRCKGVATDSNPRYSRLVRLVGLGSLQLLGLSFWALKIHVQPGFSGSACCKNWRHAISQAPTVESRHDRRKCITRPRSDNVYTVGDYGWG